MKDSTPPLNRDERRRSYPKTLGAENVPSQAEQGLEYGLVTAFRFFIVFRLLLWLLLYNGGRIFPEPLLLSAANTRIFATTALLDGLILFALFWPRWHLRLNQRYFALLLVFNCGVLFYGHTNLLIDSIFAERLPNNLAFYTPYSLFLATTVLFVAWQYNIKAVLIYSGMVISTLLFLLWQFGFLTINQFFLTIFGALLTIILPGWLIARMMTQQRIQRTALAIAAKEQARTNEQLVHYTASLEELTISRERNRLARELHDTLAHSLSAVTVQLAAVETLWENNPEAAKTLLTQADESARQGLEEARRALQALRASPLEDLGLGLALEVLAKEAAARAGVTLHLDLPKDNLSFLEPHLEQSIYRVAQETLENSVRHAEAQAFWVTLAHTNAEVHLTVRDDGQGFDATKSTPSGHYGLAGLAERASVIGGNLNITSSLTGGTEIQLTVPIKQGVPNQERSE